MCLGVVFGREERDKEEKEAYERARKAPGAVLKSFELNPKRDQRLEEYKCMLEKYDKFRVDVDGAQAGFPNRGEFSFDKALYDEYRAHPRAKLTREMSKLKRNRSPSPPAQK